MKWIDELKAKLKPKNATEKEKLKKYLIVFPLMFISCIVCLWLIFSPSSDDDSSRGRANTELPDGSSEEMHERKIEAYEAEALEAEHNQRVTDAASLESVTDTIALQPDSVPSEIESSAQAYQSVQASLEDFYIPEDQSAARVAELQARIDELEMQNAYALQQTQQPNEVELMEKSYQLAAQYLGTGNSGQQAVIVDDSDKKDRKVMPVNQVNRNVVSSLSAATSGRSFSTAVGGKHQNFKNTISACIASDQSVIDGQSVKLRTLEPMWIGNSLLPKNTTVVGSARLQGERLEITIESIEALGCIMKVDLAVYDSDGQEGINIPNSMESDALKEIGANMGSTVGSSINISTNAGAQIVSDVGRGLLNGVGQYLTKKVRQVKVHLKSGYKVMLKQVEQ